MSARLSRRSVLTLAAGLAAAPVWTPTWARTPSGPGAGMQGRVVPVRDTRLWVEDYGPRDAPALLYVHGGPGLGVFEFSHYLRDRLAKDRRLILVDQRGVLRSDPLADGAPMSLDVLVDDYEALRQTLEAPRWSILGHSWGGPIALRYANRHPATVDRVVFENPVLDADATARNLLTHAADALDQAGRSEDAAAVRRIARRRATARVWDGVNEALNRLPNRQALYVYDPAFLGFYGRISADSGIPDARWGQGARMAMALLADPASLAPAWNAVSALSQPTLLIRGETDPSMSASEMAVMSAKANVTVATVPRSGHFVHVEQPEAFTRVVEAFLNA